MLSTTLRVATHRFTTRRPTMLPTVGMLLVLTPLAPGADLVNFKRSEPEVRFDLPRSVAVHEVAAVEGVGPLAEGERLVAIELPVSVLVNRGDVGRVKEVVMTVDGAAAGLTVHSYSPATRLESEFTGDITVESTSGNERQIEASLGGLLPVGGAVAQITPGVSLGRQTQETETEKLARRAPKQAVVVSSPINERRGVVFKFRPYSQTTLEGEHTLRVTFIAPADWEGGSIDVNCQATGRRKVLFVKKPATWSRKAMPVALRLPGSQSGEIHHTTAKPMVDAPDSDDDNEQAAPAPARSETAEPAIWKPRTQPEPLAESAG